MKRRVADIWDLWLSAMRQGAPNVWETATALLVASIFLAILIRCSK